MDHHICASTARIPPPFSHTSSTSPQAPTLITQGAEAIVYRTVFLSSSTPCALKYRPPKEYRHPVLDRRLTRARILGEARVLVRCRKEGIKVPAVLALDADGELSLLLLWLSIPRFIVLAALDYSLVFMKISDFAFSYAQRDGCSPSGLRVLRCETSSTSTKT